MCKEQSFVQSFAHLLAVTVFITYVVPIASPTVGVDLAQNALFSIDIPKFTYLAHKDIHVVSMIGVHQIDTGLVVDTHQWADLQDIHCTEDWISCTDLHLLHLFLYSALLLSLTSIVFSCCKFYKLFAFSSFLLIVCVVGTVLASTKITSDVAHKIHDENDALTFVCETSGFDSSSACIFNYAKMVFDETSDQKMPVPSGWQFKLSESGVSIYASGLLIGLCASSAFVCISSIALFIWFFFRALCCCCCCMKKRHGEYDQFLNEGSINRL